VNAAQAGGVGVQAAALDYALHVAPEAHVAVLAAVCGPALAGGAAIMSFGAHACKALLTREAHKQLWRREMTNDKPEKNNAQQAHPTNAHFYDMVPNMVPDMHGRARG
jgi:hypothetical protein